MRLSELCIRRPVMTTLLMASLLLAGFFGYRQLPIAAIPRIEVPTITVTRAVSRAPAPTPWRSRSPRRSSGSSPPSPASRRSPRSTPRATPRSRWSSTSTATSTPPRSTCSRRSRWRPRACPRTCRRRRPTARSIPPTRPVIFLALTSDTAPSQEMNEFADKVMSPRLSTLPGVAQININGAQKRAVRIKYDLDALATRGISRRRDPAAPLAALTSVSPLGSIRTSAARSTSSRPRAPSRPPPTSSRWSSPGATARRCGCRTSPRSRIRSRTTRRAPSSTARARSSSRCSASPTPTRWR